LFITLVALVMLVDPSVYRSQLEWGASTAFGRDVQFEGPVAIEPSLRPRVIIDRFRVSNPDWASRPYLAEAERVDVRVRLLPLLWGDVDVISVAFKSVYLLLEEGPKGDHNFTFGTPGEAAALPDIDHFSLAQAVIAYARPGEQTRRLHLENASIVNTPGDPIVITAGGKVQSADVAVSLSVAPGERGEAALDLATLLRRARLEFKVKAPERGFRFSDYVIGRKATIEVSEFEGEARPGGPLTVSARATLNQAPIEMKVAVDPLSVLVQRPQGPWIIDLEVLGSVTRFTAKGSVSQPFELRGFDVDYGLTGQDIHALLPLFDLVLPLVGAYTVTGHILDHPESTAYEIAAKTEKTEISGNILVHYDQKPPRLVAHLASEQLYVQELIPVAAGTHDAQGRERVIPDYTLPLEALRELDSEWHVNAKNVYTDAGKIGDMNFKMTVRNGRLVLESFTVVGSEGSRIVGTGEIDASRDPAFTKLEYRIERLNYGLLLAQAEVTELVKGRVDVTLGLSGIGNTRHDFLSSANGQVVIVGGPGEFGSRNLDLWAAPLVSTMLSPEWKEQDVTKLNCLVARIEVQDGIARTDSILIDTERITVAGSGTLNLDTEELDLVLSPNPKEATFLSLASPAHVTGSLVSPKAERTELPPERVALGGLLAGLINPAFLILAFSHVGGDENPCAAAVEEVSAMPPEE
jgi:uncharacterized protein involved in outer membrane biogenesis